MKVGILTLHYAINQGAILQSFALQETIKKLGHTVEFIDYRPMYPVRWRDFISKSPKGLYVKYLNTLRGLWWEVIKDDFGKVNQRSPMRYKNIKDLSDNYPEYDVYIVGSDQVWNFNNNLSPVYLLEWVKQDSRLVSYAASMGQCEVPKELHESLKKSLSRFSAISLREKKACDFISSLLPDRKIYHTLDPTLLLSAKEYDKIIEPIKVSGDFFVTYILNVLDSVQIEIIDKIKNILGCKLVNLRNPSSCIYLFGKDEDNRVVTPYQWLNYIKRSKVVVCGSFHAVVFSLIFHKPFLVIMPMATKTKGGNVRILSLLEPLKLTHHCIYEAEGSDIEKIISERIDWEYVDRKISELKKKSLDFLVKSIK